MGEVYRAREPRIERDRRFLTTAGEFHVGVLTDVNCFIYRQI
jgi:hypothetical protein